MSFINRSLSLAQGASRVFAKTFQFGGVRVHEGGAMSKRVLILLAPGAEELELVAPADVLRRGGVNVTVAGVVGRDPVKCRSETVILPDMSLAEALTKGPYDAVVLPGGLRGAEILSESKEVGALLKKQEDSGRIIAAICAGPTALKAHGIGIGKRLTSYPTTAEVMTQGEVYKYESDNVVVDRNLVTSRGPATALQFALTILEQVAGKNTAQEVAQAMLYDY